MKHTFSIFGKRILLSVERSEKSGEQDPLSGQGDSRTPLLTFSDFPNIFGGEIKPDQITEARKKLYSFPRAWMQAKHHSYTLDSLALDPKKPLFSVDCGGVRYECLFLARKGKRLFVNFRGAAWSHDSYPRFLRWKYGKRLGANMLCVDDPMHESCGNPCVKWYYGTKERSYLVEMLPLVKKAMACLGVAAENVTFLGSSGGGYAALYMANLLDGSAGIALSPQTVLSQWSAPTCEYFDELGIDLRGEDKKFNRSRLLLTNPKSVFVMAVNALSGNDYTKHFLPFCAAHGITPKYGISAHKNIITWVHGSDGMDLHGCNPEIELRFLDYLVSRFRSGADINGINKMSYVFNERLNMYHLADKAYQNAKALCDTIIKSFTQHSLRDYTGRYMLYDMKKRCIEFGKKELRNKMKVEIRFTDKDKCFLKLRERRRPQTVTPLLHKYLPELRKKYVDINGSLSDTKVSVDCQINADGSISFATEEGFFRSTKDGRAVSMKDGRAAFSGNLVKSIRFQLSE